MALLSKHEPRRFRRPADGEEDVQVALVPGMSRAARRAAVATAKPEISKPDPARQALLDVIALRGKPIQRKRGMVPSLRFQRAAGEYIKRHHYNFCVQFARGRSARHIPLSDMIQACLLGAYIALERFDENHPESYRFLSYAKWYMLCECNRLLHKEECLVVVPQAVKDARHKLAAVCPDDVSDEEAADLLGMSVEDVRAARGAHLGHEHRRIDERARSVRRSFADVRAAHDERAAELRESAGLADALRRLDPLLRGALWREYGVGEDEGAPEPATEQSRRALRHLALRRLREELEADDE